MTDKIQKIREGIEKLKSQLLRGACSSQVAMETRCKEEAYNDVLALLDTMQEEPTSWLDEFRAKLDSMSKEDFKKIFDKYAIDFEEEPISEDLEEAANNALNNVLNAHEIVNVRSCLEMFKSGVNWQKQQDQSTIELAEDHAMFAGMEKMKEEMMTKSIEAVVSQVPCSNEIILYNPSSVDSYYLPQEMNKLGLNKGDKVKVIIIKED